MTDNPPEPIEVTPSGPVEKRVLEAFAGMMRSCDCIRDAVRTTRERVNAQNEYEEN